jgi:DNA-binding IclR family transcriptional regulator
MVQAMGFAMRSRGRDPSTSSIATPVMRDGAVAATVGLTFFSRVVSRAEMEGLGATLQATAQAISGRLFTLEAEVKAAVPWSNQ